MRNMIKLAFISLIASMILLAGCVTQNMENVQMQNAQNTQNQDNQIPYHQNQMGVGRGKIVEKIMEI